MGFHDPETEGLELLATCDESEDYNIDETQILWDKKTREYVVRSASGCSCWEGEFDETRFRSMKKVAVHLLGPGQARYNPSLLGAKKLIEEAKAAAQKK